MKPFWFSVAILAVISFGGLHGCVIIPLPSESSGDDIKDIRFKRNLSKADILQRYGEPLEKTADERFFLYSYTRTSEAVFLAYPVYEEDIHGTPRKFVWLAEFDTAGKLVDKKKFRCDIGKFAAKNIGLYTSLAQSSSTTQSLCETKDRMCQLLFKFEGESIAKNYCSQKSTPITWTTD